MSLLSSEWTRLHRRPLNRAMGACAVGFAVVEGLATVVRAREIEAYTVFDLSAQFEQRFSGLLFTVRTLMIVFAATLVASEHTFDTLKVVLPRLPSRWPLLASKLLLLLGLGAVTTVVLEALSVASLSAVAAHQHMLQHLRPELFVRLAWQAPLTVAEVLFWALLAFGLSVLTRSQVLSIVASLLALGLISAASDFPSPVVAMLLPSHHFDNLAGLAGNSRVLDIAQSAFEAEVPGWVSVAVLCAWLAGALVPAFVVFERRDITGTPG